MVDNEIATRVLSVIGNSGVRVEHTETDEHNREIRVEIFESDRLVVNAAQRLGQRVAPEGWTVRVETKGANHGA